MNRDPFDVVSVPVESDQVAPDGSEIRVLTRLDTVSMAHGTLPPNGASRAIRHHSIDELWYVLDGAAELWRRSGVRESIETVHSGQSLAIPARVSFQFRTIGSQPFTFIMCTTPPWPGSNEAEFVAGVWKDPDDSL